MKKNLTFFFTFASQSEGKLSKGVCNKISFESINIVGLTQLLYHAQYLHFQQTDCIVLITDKTLRMNFQVVKDFCIYYYYCFRFFIYMLQVIVKENRIKKNLGNLKNFFKQPECKKYCKLNV